MEYSAILQSRISLASSDAGCTASAGQTPMQRPQPTQRLWSMRAFFSTKEMAPWAQFLRQLPQLMQRSSST